MIRHVHTAFSAARGVSVCALVPVYVPPGPITSGTRESSGMKSSFETLGVSSIAVPFKFVYLNI